MFEEKNPLKSHVFQKNYSADPFREENFIFKNTENETEKEEAVFKLHLPEKAPSPTQKTEEQSHPHHVEKTTNEKRTLKTILQDASRQIIASAIILVLGFFLLNWSAYYQIAKSKWNELTGNEEISPLQDLVGDNNEQTDPLKTVVLKTSSDVQTQKKQIPSLALEVTPIDNRIIIPRIDQNIPIVNVSSENLIERDWSALERDMQDALQGGVVHYPGTSLPGQTGNIAITGHSSYFPWDAGRFKDVFALLHQVVKGDDIVIFFDQEKYVYEVEDIKVVLPDDIDILKPTPDDRLTLITCTPVGTNLKRLVVIAKPVEDDVKIARSN